MLIGVEMQSGIKKICGLSPAKLDQRNTLRSRRMQSPGVRPFPACCWNMCAVASRRTWNRKNNIEQESPLD